MKVVYSFGLNNRNRWLNKEYEYYVLSLSVNQSKKFFGKVDMITNSESLETIEKLNLPFDNITTDLDTINHYDSRLWALGKIKAYSLQKEPFIHIDNDCFLLKPLEERILKAEIGVQSKEGFYDVPSNILYPRLIEEFKERNIIMPEYYNIEYAYSQGIYCVNNLDFNKKYCEEVFKFIDLNYDKLIQKVDLSVTPILWEQYTLAAFANKNAIKVETVKDRYEQKEFENLGFYHLMHNKKNEQYYKKIKDVVKQTSNI